MPDQPPDDHPAPQPPMLRLVGEFLDHLVVERGLSANTVSAYRRDLTRYCDWLAGRGIEAPDEV
ncbi:site-specific integrase, partial [Nitratireductor kimnyeongensis]